MPKIKRCLLSKKKKRNGPQATLPKLPLNLSSTDLSKFEVLDNVDRLHCVWVMQIRDDMYVAGLK